MGALITLAGCGGASGPPGTPAGDTQPPAAASNAGFGQGPDAGGEGEPLDGGGGGEVIDPFELEEWDIVEFTDPRDASVYEIIDGRVIIAFKDPPDIPEMDPNYFDVERDPETDPYYGQFVFYYQVVETIDGLTQLTDPEIAVFVAAENLTVFSEWPMVAGMAAVLPEGQTVDDAVANWPSEYPDLIESVDPDALQQLTAWPQSDPNDQHFTNQWNLNELFAYDINIEAAWRNGYTGSGSVCMAILDTGVDYQHPDLQARSTWWGCNTGDKAKSTRFYYRWYGGGEPWQWIRDLSPANAKDVGHGTCVAGTAAATINNAYCTAGIAGYCKYYPIAMKYKGGFSRSAVINAFQAVGAIKGIYSSRTLFPGRYIRWHNLEVVNCSFGSYAYNSTCARHVYRLSRYMLFVCTAGNDGRSDRNIYPGAYSPTMAVAAHDASGDRSEWGSASSNFAPGTDIAAPGSAIYAPDYLGTSSRGYTMGYATETVNTDWKGTSAAAPHVAAVAALIAAEQRYESYAPWQIRYQIIWHEASLSDPDDPQFNNIGRLDAYAALSQPIW